MTRLRAGRDVLGSYFLAIKHLTILRARLTDPAIHSTVAAVWALIMPWVRALRLQTTAVRAKAAGAAETLCGLPELLETIDLAADIPGYWRVAMVAADIRAVVKQAQDLCAPLLTRQHALRHIQDSPLLALHLHTLRTLRDFRVRIANQFAGNPAALKAMEAVARFVELTLLLAHDWLVNQVSAMLASGLPGCRERARTRLISHGCNLRMVHERILLVGAGGPLDSVAVEAAAKYAEKNLHRLFVGGRVAVDTLNPAACGDFLEGYFSAMMLTPGPNTSVAPWIYLHDLQSVLTRHTLGMRATAIHIVPAPPSETRDERRHKRTRAKAEAIHRRKKYERKLRLFRLYGRRDTPDPGGDDVDPPEGVAVVDIDPGGDEGQDGSADDVREDEQLLDSGEINRKLAAQRNVVETARMARNLLLTNAPHVLPQSVISGLVHHLRVYDLPLACLTELLLLTGIPAEKLRYLKFLGAGHPTPENGLYVGLSPVPNMLDISYHIAIEDAGRMQSVFRPVVPCFRCLLPLVGESADWLNKRGNAAGWKGLVFEGMPLPDWRPAMVHLGLYPAISGRMDRRLINTAYHAMVKCMPEEALAHISDLSYDWNPIPVTYVHFSLFALSSYSLTHGRRLAAALNDRNAQRDLALVTAEMLSQHYSPDYGVGSHKAIKRAEIQGLFERVYGAARRLHLEALMGQPPTLNILQAMCRRLRVAVRVAAELAVASRDHANADDVKLLVLSGQLFVAARDKETMRGDCSRLAASFDWLHYLLKLQCDIQQQFGELVDMEKPLELHDFNHGLAAALGIELPPNERINWLRHTAKTLLAESLSWQTTQRALGHDRNYRSRTSAHAAICQAVELAERARGLNEMLPFPNHWR